MTLTRFVDSKGQLVVVGKELGVGGQGAVHLVEGRPNEVAKVYLKSPSAADVRKLEAQVQACRPEILSISAWPSALLKTSSGSVQGLIMPLVDLAEYTEIHNLFGPASRRKYFPKADWASLILVARNVARAFAVIHDGNHVVGDVSSRNILVSQQGTLKLIDTDSFQVRSGQTVFPCPVGTAESTPPELQGQTFGTFIRTTNHDLFGMAVIIFQLLFQGRHPYSGIHSDGTMPNPAQAIKNNKFAYSQHVRGVRPPPQTLQLDDLPSDVAVLFERAFAPSTNPRPTAKEWDQGLASLARTVATCPQDATHKHVRGKRCPWCAHNQSATAKGGFVPNAKRLDIHQELNRVWQGAQKIHKPSAPQHVWTPTKIMPLSLKYPNLSMMAPLPVPTARLMWARVRTFFALMMFCLLAVMIWRGGDLTTEVGLGAIAWIMLATSNGNHIRAAHKAAQEKQDRGAIERYEQEKNDIRTQLQAHIDEAQKNLKELQIRQQTESALVKYQSAFERLEAQRTNILALAADEAGAIHGIQDVYRQAALDQYLKQQVLTPGLIAGVGEAAVSKLQKFGVWTAYDVNEHVRSVSGINRSRADHLLLWRKAHEGFFNFDATSIPAGQVSAALIERDQKILSMVQVLSGDINKLASDIKNWKGVEDAIGVELREKLVVVEQCKIGLKQLNELWP